MATVKELKERRGKLELQAKALIETAEADDRDLTAEEASEFDDLAAQQATLKNRIERQEKLEGLSRELDGRSGAIDRRTSPATAVDADERPRIAATARRTGVLRNFKGTVGGLTEDERAFRFGMWARALVTLNMPGRYSFTDAVDFARENGWLNVASSSDGSGHQYLIPHEFGSDLIVLREQFGVARRLFLVVPMGSDTRTDPRLKGGLTAHFKGETGAGTESNTTWNQVQLVAKEIIVLSRYTSALGQDSAIDFGDRLAGEISYAFSNKEDECAFNGDATSTYGGIVGIRTKLQNVDGAGADSAGLVTQGTGNTWGAIVLTDFDKVVGKLPQYADTPNAAWTMHKTFYHEVIVPLVEAAGGTTKTEIEGGNRSPRPIFKGYPVEFSQVWPKTTATSSVVAALGDFRLGASFGDRQQESIMFSEHASIGGESLFERNEIGIRGTERFDINVHDAGDATNPGPIVGLQTGS